MNKIDEVLELLKQRERESEKPKNVILWVLAIVGAVAAVAGIAYAVPVCNSGLSGRLRR